MSGDFWQGCSGNRFSCWTISIPRWTCCIEWWQIATVGAVFVTDTISQATILCIFAAFIAFIFTVIGITVGNAHDTGKIAIVCAIIRLWIPVDKAIIVDWIIGTPIIVVQTRTTSNAILLTWAVVDATLSCFSTIVQAKSVIVTTSFTIVVLNFY